MCLVRHSVAKVAMLERVGRRPQGSVAVDGKGEAVRDRRLLAFCDKVDWDGADCERVQHRERQSSARRPLAWHGLPRSGGRTLERIER